MAEYWNQDFQTGTHDFDSLNIGANNALEVVAENPYNSVYALRIRQGKKILPHRLAIFISPCLSISPLLW